MTIPEGWDVDYDVVNVGNNMKRIFIFVRDPLDANNMIFFVEALEPYFTTNDARNAWLPYLPSYYSSTPVLSAPTAEAMLVSWNSIYAVLRGEGIIDGYFADYTLRDVFQKNETTNANGVPTSYVACSVIIPGASEQYAMFYENSMQYMDAPPGLPTSAFYYTSYANNGVVVRDSLAEAQFDTMHGCLMTLDITKYLNDRSQSGIVPSTPTNPGTGITGSTFADAD